eukprot:167326-Pelagomonas_calceolata.AAC.1
MAVWRVRLLFQVTPLVADSPWIAVAVVRRYDFCAARFESYLVGGVNEVRNAFCQDFNCLCGRYAIQLV